MQSISVSKTIEQKPAEQRNAVWRDYLSLTKPRVLSLLLLTTLGAMLIAGENIPAWPLVLTTLIGGYLAAGGAGVLNCYLDRDIDFLMSRTRSRPLVAGRIMPHHALYFGLALLVLAFIVLWLGANLLTAVLAMVGAFIYVIVYSWWLKRISTQNIVIGGAAGAIPPLVGWTAVTGTLEWEAWVFFAIIFFWTPPHFWCLALIRRQDYARAGVPMFPVVYGNSQTHTHIVGYTGVLIVLTLIPFLSGSLGWIYGSIALALGGYFLYQAIQLANHPSTRRTWRLYRYSLLYLALLFLAPVLDRQFLNLLM